MLRTGERKIVREQPTPAASKSATEKSRKVYDQQVLIILRQIWMILDYICGKRLVAIMPEVIRRLEYFGELKIEPEVRAKLLRINCTWESQARPIEIKPIKNEDYESAEKSITQRTLDQTVSSWIGV